MIHAIIWIIWAVLMYYNTGIKPKACYNQLFGQYISHSVFNWFQFIYMFGGGLLLIRFLIKRLNLWAFIIFEVIIIFIVLVNFKIYFFCR